MTVLQRTLIVLGLLAGSAVARAGDYRPPAFDGRVGTIQVHNESAYPVTVTLWHPDTGQPFARWTVRAGETSLLCRQGDAVVIGSDWGVQLGDSAIMPAAAVAAWAKGDGGAGVWKTSVDRFYR